MSLETKEITADEFRGDLFGKKFPVHYDTKTGVYSFDYTIVPEDLKKEIAKLIIKRISDKDPAKVKAQLDTILKTSAPEAPRAKGEITAAAEKAVADVEGALAVESDLRKIDPRLRTPSEEAVLEKSLSEINLALLDQRGKEARNTRTRLEEETYNEKGTQIETLKAIKDKLLTGAELTPEEIKLREKVDEAEDDLHDYMVALDTLEAYNVIEPLDEAKRKEAGKLYSRIKDAAAEEGVDLLALKQHIKDGTALSEQETAIRTQIDALDEASRNAVMALITLLAISTKRNVPLQTGKVAQEEFDKIVYEDSRKKLADLEAKKDRTSSEELEYLRARDFVEAYKLGIEKTDPETGDVYYERTPQQQADYQKLLEKEYTVAKAMIGKLLEKRTAGTITADETATLNKYETAITDYEAAHPLPIYLERGINLNASLKSTNFNTEISQEEQRFRSAVRRRKELVNMGARSTDQEADFQTQQKVIAEFTKTNPSAAAIEKDVLNNIRLLREGKGRQREKIEGFKKSENSTGGPPKGNGGTAGNGGTSGSPKRTEGASAKKAAEAVAAEAARKSNSSKPRAADSSTASVRVGASGGKRNSLKKRKQPKHKTRKH
jgi:hypothetical protein